MNKKSISTLEKNKNIMSITKKGGSRPGCGRKKIQEPAKDFPIRAKTSYIESLDKIQRSKIRAIARSLIEGKEVIDFEKLRENYDKEIGFGSLVFDWFEKEIKEYLKIN